METRELNIICDSLQGLQRKENCDGFTVIEDRDYSLILLFDGVSSYENSPVGIKKIIKGMKENHRSYFHDSGYFLKEALGDMHDILRVSDMDGMFTTVCALYLPRDIKKPAKFSHLGDSRIYSYVSGNLTLETEDHNVSELPHVLTKCLGLETLKVLDFYEKEIEAGSKEGFLLCTDGFYPVFQNSMVDYIKTAFFEQGTFVKKIIRNNLEFKNFDDATYVIVTIE